MSAVFATDEQLKKFPETVIVAAEYDYLRVAATTPPSGWQALVYRYAPSGTAAVTTLLDMLGTIVQSEELCLTIAAELKAL